MNDNVTDLEWISGSRRRDVWGSSGTFDPTIRARIVEGLAQRMTSAGCDTLYHVPGNKGYFEEN